MNFEVSYHTKKGQKQNQLCDVHIKQFLFVILGKFIGREKTSKLLIIKYLVDFSKQIVYYINNTHLCISILYFTTQYNIVALIFLSAYFHFQGIIFSHYLSIPCPSPIFSKDAIPLLGEHCCLLNCKNGFHSINELERGRHSMVNEVYI